MIQYYCDHCGKQLSRTFDTQTKDDYHKLVFTDSFGTRFEYEVHLECAKEFMPKMTEFFPFHSYHAAIQNTS